MANNPHVTEAREFLQMADEAGDWDTITRAQQQWVIERYHAHAQVKATIALAEEQRTANLLAFIVDARKHGASGHDLVAVGEQVLARLGLNDKEA